MTKITLKTDDEHVLTCVDFILSGLYAKETCKLTREGDIYTFKFKVKKHDYERIKNFCLDIGVKFYTEDK